MSLILSGTDGLSDIDGSAATPAIRGTDANTGIFFPAADTIAFAEGGAEAMRIDSSGSVGIGTSSPTTKLDVNAMLAGYGGNLTAPIATITGANSATNGGGNLRVFANTSAADNVGGSMVFGGYYSAQVASVDYAEIAGRKQSGQTTGGYLTFATRADVGIQTERMRIDSSGNVGIGTTTMNGKFNSTPKATYNPGSTTWAESALSTAGSYGGGLSMIDGTAGYGLNVESSGGALVIRQGTVGSSPTERMRIDSSGNLLVGATTGTNARLYVVSDATAVTPFILNNTASGSASNTIVSWRRNGSVTGTIDNTGTTTAYNTSSDYRLKNTIEPMTGALAKVTLLKPCTYKWNADDSDGQGFIAHELAEVCPQAVSGEKDAVDEDGNIKPQGIDTSFLVATLTAAIQEQQALITALTARITALENK
jgi:hypothetical protein